MIKTFLHNKKSDKGFVLAELIVAIALLAMVSGIILQLFLVASTSNRSAQDLDSASSQAVSVMERLRALDDSQIRDDEVFSGAAISAIDGGLEIRMAYDANWNPIGAYVPGAGFELVATIIETQPQRELGAAFSGTSTDTGAKMQAALYDIAVEVFAGRVNNETGETYTESLLAFHSGKYVTKEAA